MAVRDVTGLYEEFGDDRLPPGQRRTEEFPVFTRGETPDPDMESSEIRATGSVESERTYTREALMELPAETQRQDVHCVTGWSGFGMVFTGLTLPAILERAGLSPEAEHVLFHALDGYTTDLSLEAANRPEVLLAYEHDGEPLDRDHGGFLRVLTPHKYAYKGAKWVHEIEVLPESVRGYWEKRGYSTAADPWAEDRYS
ncbi:MAG: molybdopterin-dependent oxidoreductase [Halodesulfurarchaeum sp.]